MEAFQILGPGPLCYAVLLCLLCQLLSSGPGGPLSEQCQEHCQTGKSLRGPWLPGLAALEPALGLLPSLHKGPGHFHIIEASARDEVWGWHLPR